MKRSLIALTASAVLLLSACSSQGDNTPDATAAAPSAAASEAASESASAAPEVSTTEAASESASAEATQGAAAAGELALAVPEVDGFTPLAIEPPKKISFNTPSGCLVATGVDAPPPFEGATDRAASEHALEHIAEAIGGGTVVSKDAIQEVKMADGTQMLMRSVTLEKDGLQVPMVIGIRIDVESNKAIHFLGACQDKSAFDVTEATTFISSLRLESGNPGSL